MRLSEVRIRLPIELSAATILTSLASLSVCPVQLPGQYAAKKLWCGLVARVGPVGEFVVPCHEPSCARPAKLAWGCEAFPGVCSDIEEDH